MSRREFQFTDGSSNKFWAIEVEGKSQTVHFGRVGTSGQAQTKEFGSETEANKASDKLIAEKTKKGYKEVTTGAKPAATVVPKVKPAEGNEETKPKGKEAKTAEAAPAAPPIAAIAEVTRTIDLAPEDWRWAGKNKSEPKVETKEAPFDLEACIERARKVPITGYGWDWQWDRVGIPSSMSKEEAHFWFTAMTTLDMEEVRQTDGNRTRELPKVLAERLADFKPKGTLSLADVKTALIRAGRLPSPEVVLPLARLFSTAELFDLLQEDYSQKKKSTPWGDQTSLIRENLQKGICKYVIPRLQDKEAKALEARIRPALDPSKMPTDHYAEFPPEYFMAVALGMRRELATLVNSWTDDRYAEHEWKDHHERPQLLIFGLGDGKLVEAAFRRLRLKLRTPEQVRAFLALTEYSALDIVRDSILGGTKIQGDANAEDAAKLLRPFCLVKAPEAAPHMLELKLSSKAPSLARQWLDEQVGNAIAGLVPIASGRGKLAEAAVEYLREAKKRGHEKVIRSCLKGATADVAESIKKNVLDFEEKEYAPLDSKTTPPKLKAAFELKGKPGKLPAWAAVTSLPPILVGEKKLSDEQVSAVLAALQRSSMETPDPLLAALKDHADAASLDALAWKLFQLWQADGGPSKEKWAMAALGLLGGDVSALKLTPLVRNWPGESQHQRAVFGLDCLRAIGTDTALMQLNGIAQKLKFKGLKQKATEAMEAIAKSKGLTRSQLEDRVVPDCDLDERGSRVFDFGTRQFRFVLGPEMKPMLKDAEGKVKTDLPKPGSKDDATKAEAAVNDWKLMKKQIKEVANIQAQRLEQAMVTGRRWTVADFETLLVKHPLMTNLVRLVLWGGYDKKGKLLGTFRVTEDQTYADVKDNEYKLKGIDQVGIIHPLNLPDDQKAAWGEVFSDYEIVPPFPQMGRTILTLEKDEVKKDEIKRFEGKELAAPTLVFGLEKLGWVRGVGMDGGCFDEHSKPFPSCDVTAVVHYDGSVGFGFIDPNEMLKMQECYFVRGMREPSGYAPKEKKLKLGDVDPVAVSEVLADLTSLAAKAK